MEATNIQHARQAAVGPNGRIRAVRSLYVAKCGDYYKIGIAADIDSRLRTLQIGNPLPVELVMWFPFDYDVHAVDREREWHTRFHHLRVSGEWFLLSDNDLRKMGSVERSRMRCDAYCRKQGIRRPTVQESQEEMLRVTTLIHDKVYDKIFALSEKESRATEQMDQTSSSYPIQLQLPLPEPVAQVFGTKIGRGTRVRNK